MGTTDPELARLLEQYEIAVRFNALTAGVTRAINDDEPDYAGARAALLAHIARHYVRRERLVPDEWDDLDATAPVKTGYRAARGILPWKPGDELPEERIRRLRDDDRQHTLHLDDAGNVAGGAPDFEGER